MKLAEQEEQLSWWMDANERLLGWSLSGKWQTEHDLIASLTLPLNLDQNERCGFHAALTALRREARERARGMAVIAPTARSGSG